MCRVHHEKRWAGRNTSWNQDCQEKYQRQICRWHHPHGRKWRIKEPFDEGERREWKPELKLNIQKTKIMPSGPITSWEIDETVETVSGFIFLGSKITADGDCSHEIKRRLLLVRKIMTNLDSILKCRDITLPTKVCLVKAMVFPVVMYGCDSWICECSTCESHFLKENWVRKNWCFWSVVLEKTLVSPMDCEEIQPVHPKGDQSWVFIGRTDAEAEMPILWPPHAKSWLIGKDPDAGRDWGQEDKGMTEDEMAGWHHRLDGHKFE